MTDSFQQGVISLLQDMERRSLGTAAMLPQDLSGVNIWEGIMFSILMDQVATPLDEVGEILAHPPVITLVPGTRSWLLGVANIRGNLLPIVDLQAFLGGKPIVVGKRSRILVIDHDGITTGLLVGDVKRVQQFAEKRLNKVPETGESIKKYLTGAIEHEEERIPIFSMRLLVKSPDFQVAAA